MITCTVLNATHEPLSVVSPERGLVMTLEGKAYIVEVLPDRVFRTVTREFPVPTSVILKDYHSTGSNFYNAAVLNQSNMFIRDDYRCGYCQRHAVELKSSEYLTRDHVIPQSRGGADTWTNILTACSLCNHRKDDLTLAQFAKVLEGDIAEAEERLMRATGQRQQEATGQRLAQLQTMLESVKRLQARGPKQPRVYEILGKRARKKSWRE